MRIVHFNTDDSRGGAARAAIRLHRGLLERDEQSTFLVRKKTGLHNHVAGIAEANQNAGPGYADMIEEWYVSHRRSELSETIFSGGVAGVPVTDHPAVREAGVLNLHWVAGFLTPEEIGNLLRLNKPVVWTLHDQWPMTGGCHYSAGCRQFTDTCQTCPQLEADEVGLVPAAFLDRLEAYGSRITAVSPSHWMAQQARASRMFRDARVEVIPNSLDHDIFRPLGKVAVREKLGIPADAFVLLFACSAAFEKRKGIPLFRTLLKELGAGVFSLFVGWNTAETSDAPAQKHFGFVNEDPALCEIYNAADVLVHLASEDNLPNMPLEAMACGTPVLGLKNGGLPEIVDDGVSGLLIPGGNFGALVEATRSLMGDRKRCEAYGVAARKIVETRFTRAIQASRYAKLYPQLAADSRPQLQNYHVRKKLSDLIAISADLRLAAEVRKTEQRVREQMQLEIDRLNRRVRKIERNVGFRIVSGVTDGARDLGRKLRGNDSGRSG